MGNIEAVVRNGAGGPLVSGSTLVSVTIVTFNNENCLSRCLESVLAQTWQHVEVIIVDNASSDNTRGILDRYADRCSIILNSENRGFSIAQNQAIRRSRGEWVLVLNSDALLRPDFVSSLLDSADFDDSIGTVCGKLLRGGPDLSIPDAPQIDSAGMYFTPTFRHFDRGSGESDRAEYSVPAYVFGATGAAALYRRAMIDDISMNGEFFDEDFYFSREDADLAWRAQLLGWKCLYVPAAVAYHVRRVLPSVRRALPGFINYHSVKNRFLMRIKNASLGLCLRNFIFIVARDLGIVAYCLLRERSSLPAFSFVIRHWSRTWAKRCSIQQRRRVPESYMRQWFRFRPVTLPAPTPSEPAGADNSLPSLKAPAGKLR